jgi:hypothetical protein
MNIGIMARKSGKIASHALFRDKVYGVKPDTLKQIIRNLPEVGTKRGVRDKDHRYFYKCPVIASAYKQLKDAIDDGVPLSFMSAERIAIMAHSEYLLAGYHEREYGITDDMVVDTDEEVMRLVEKKNNAKSRK